MADDQSDGSVCDGSLVARLRHASPDDRKQVVGVSGGAIALGGFLATYIEPSWLGVPIGGLFVVYGTGVGAVAAFCPRRTVLVDVGGLSVGPWEPASGQAGWVVIPHFVVTSQSPDPLALMIVLRMPIEGHGHPLRVPAVTGAGEANVPTGLQCPIQLEQRGSSEKSPLCFRVDPRHMERYGQQLRPGKGALEMRDRANRSDRIAEVELLPLRQRFAVDV